MNPPAKKLSFGLNKAALPRQPAKPSAKGKGRASTGFSFGGAADDDDDEPLAPPPQAKGVSTAKLSRAQRLKQQQELELDKSAYQYDEVYERGPKNCVDLKRLQVYSMQSVRVPR
ncbi:hypothetical protein JCM16303_004931 [Sporobolomyces ruberrimus]